MEDRRRMTIQWDRREKREEEKMECRREGASVIIIKERSFL
jgi:hypothetical protein